MPKSQYIRDLQCDKVYWFLYSKKNLQINSSPTKKYFTWYTKIEISCFKAKPFNWKITEV